MRTIVCLLLPMLAFAARVLSEVARADLIAQWMDAHERAARLTHATGHRGRCPKAAMSAGWRAGTTRCTTEHLYIEADQTQAQALARLKAMLAWGLAALS
jgi:hypothetical protein